MVCRCNFLKCRCLPEPPDAAVGSTPVPWGGGLISSIVGLCSACRSGASSIRCSGFASACCSGTPVSCCAGISFVCCSRTSLVYGSGTSSPPLGWSHARVLCGGSSVLGGGADGASSSSNHSSTTLLRVRVVWSPPSEMLPGLRGVAVVVFLFFCAGSSAAGLFP